MKSTILVYILDSAEYSFEKIYRWSDKELEEMHTENPVFVKRMTLEEFEEQINLDEVENFYCDRIRIVVPKLSLNESSILESLAKKLDDYDKTLSGDEEEQNFDGFYKRFEQLVAITGREPQKRPKLGATRQP